MSNETIKTTKERLLVVCPGRGTYNANELNYLQRYHSNQQSVLTRFDEFRRDNKQLTITELDGASQFDLKQHTAGDNASPLIFSCAWADFLSIDRDRYEIVAVTGNSMGWYIALACAGALSDIHTLELINTMGTLMQQALVGGQIVYPLVDENWQPVPQRKQWLLNELKDINKNAGQDVVWVSIDLGGMLVLAGTDKACKELMQRLPTVDERFPLKIYNHAAFHTPLQQQVMTEGREKLQHLSMAQPEIPLIDGRGHIWNQYSTDTSELWDYTLGHQVVKPYHFTKAIQVATLEFAVDKIAILGPGETLGSAVAQSLIKCGWQDWKDKSSFQASQAEAPKLISLGKDGQRELIVT